MTIKTLYPNIEPSLSLDFAKVKALDPRITFTRASEARYYDGKTVAKAEENLVQRSQEFDNGEWLKPAATVTANTNAAPDGTTTAETVDEGVSSNYHQVEQVIATVSGLTYTLSVFLKYVDRQFVNLSFWRAAGGSYAAVSFDIQNGTVSNTAAAGSGYSVLSSSITSFGNGWYRCSITSVVGADANRCGFAPSDTGIVGLFGLTTYTGTSKTFLTWGAQLEQRSTATAYTPTTTQPITNYIPVLLTADSGQARFDHNPVTGESLGLLIEEQRSNLVTYSEQFDNAAWNKNGSTITANTVVAPDGTLTGDSIIPSTTSSLSRTVEKIITTTAGVAYTHTIYAKAAGYTRISLWWPVTGAYSTFDLSLGTILTNSGGATSTITAVGNGWYRCASTFTQSTTNGTSVRIYVMEPGTTAPAQWVGAGDGFSGIYIWGAQLEAGAFPTSYIPTVASQVTRAADAASMVGDNFSSWYRQDQGAAYAEASAYAVGSNRIFSISSTTATYGERIESYYGSELHLRGQSNTSGLNFNLDAGTHVTGVFGKIAGAWQVGSQSASLNGGVVASSSDTRSMPLVNRLNIGADAAGVGFLNGTIRKLSYYPKALTATELQALTS